MCASLRPRTCSLMLNRLRDTAFRRLLLDPILEIDTRSTLFTAPPGASPEPLPARDGEPHGAGRRRSCVHSVTARSPRRTAERFGGAVTGEDVLGWRPLSVVSLGCARTI